MFPFTSRGTRLIIPRKRLFLIKWRDWISVGRWTQRRASSLPPSTVATTSVSLHSRGHLASSTTSIFAWMVSILAPHMHRRSTTTCQSSPLCNWREETQSIRILKRGRLSTAPTITPNSVVSCWRRTSSFDYNRMMMLSSSSCIHHTSTMNPSFLSV